MRVAGASQLHLFKGRRQRLEAAPYVSEFRLAVAFADTLKRCARPDWRWTHFPAGELRETVTGERLKRMGLKPGWPDYQFVSPAGQIHFLELKRRRGAELTDEQEAFRDWCKACAIPWQLARTYDRAIEIVTKWGVLRLEVRPQ